jgi:two-component system response regulator AtoC
MTRDCENVKSKPLLLVDDDDAFRTVMGGEIASLGFHVDVAATGGEALERIAAREPAVVVLDLGLPDMSGLEVLRAIRESSPGSEVIILTGHGSIESAVEAVRLGAADYVAKPCPIAELDIRIRNVLERQALRARTAVLESGLTPRDPGPSLIGESPSFREMMALVERAATSDVAALMVGETGSGKTVLARLLHAHSPRRQRPFVLVECAALQEDLLLSELFGHDRGAFTGAVQARAGLIEVADGGTLFLDEVGELSHDAQSKLLRFLDDSIFRRVGSTTERRVDVRLVAATHRDLAQMVRQGRFREDLFYRLETVTIAVPPLRERGEDIETIAGRYVARINGRYGLSKQLTADARQALRGYDWPGNVRELIHVIEAAFVLCQDTEIEARHLGSVVADGNAAKVMSAGAPESLATLADLEREHVARVLRASGGHRGEAAKMLGISVRSLYRKLREHGLES